MFETKIHPMTSRFMFPYPNVGQHEGNGRRKDSAGYKAYFMDGFILFFSVELIHCTF